MHYTRKTEKKNSKRRSISRLSSLRPFAQLLLRIINDPSRDNGSLIAALTAVAEAWEAGRTVRLFNSDPGRPLEVHLTVPHPTATEFPLTAGDVTKSKTEKAISPPVPLLSDDQVEAIKERAQQRPWKNRGPNPPTPFEWVRDNYREWIPGLLQSHLKYDRQLYGAFTQRVRREGLPDWLDVPTEPDANLRNTTDPEQRAQLLFLRRAGALRSRQRRAAGLIR